MKGETVNVTWLSGLWQVSRKSGSDEKDIIGFMSFEVAGLMSKVVNLWHSLSDNEVMNLREWLVKSVGVKMLVSDDEYYLMELAWNEILNNFQSLTQSVARLSKKCKDPIYHSYENFVHNPCHDYVQWIGWEYRWKKMEKKVKKMERFVASMSLLSQEIEVLAECEQSFRRMKLNYDANKAKLFEFKKKVLWQRNQVQNVRDLSPWSRSYDYVVRLLARSLFTILERIILVFGNTHLSIENQQNDSSTTMNYTDNDRLARNHSFPVLSVTHSSIHPSESNHLNGFCSGSPIGNMPMLNKSKNKKKEQQLFNSQGKQLKYIGSFKGCISIENDSHVVQSCMPTNVSSMRKNIDVNTKLVNKLSLFHKNRVYFKLSLKSKLKPAPSTLGDGALALHYANVIVLIEKIFSSSATRTIDVHARDSLYNKLPTTIRTALRGKLKWYAKTVNVGNLAVEWNVVMTQILEWLAPLAHNMVKWNSERNFEKEHTTLKANVLLVQTLYFANQAKTEAAIVELLVGLHYVYKIDRKTHMRDT
ncbi:protein PSK SIMULATOR 1-like [Cicer arietinum]|uniref:Uncharacterized protein LOC101511231 n=1 Tax=Cicer arietinum TaxID=3827 RepID=A0A1S2Y0Z0_CICAR|nr:uncharacterized protein LOC101511231 [Cicer arietinum]